MKTARRQCGCTLTEALVTLAILSFGVAGIIRLQLDLVRATGEGKARTEALALTQARLEQLRAITRPDPYPETEDAELDIDGSNSRFDLHWRIAPVAGGVRYAVRVGTKWTDARGLEQEVRLDTLLPAADPAWTARTLD